MASQNPNNKTDKVMLIKRVLEDYGVPVQKIIEIGNVCVECDDYVKDIQKFREHYEEIKEIEKSLATFKDTAEEVTTKVYELNDDILQKTSWFSVNKINTDKMNAAEMTAEEMKHNVDSLNDMVDKFNSTAQEKADEVLNRRNTMRVIQLVVVGYDVACGIHKLYNSRDIQYYKEKFQNIHKEYVQPTIDSFTKDGTINDDLIKRGLWKLDQIRHTLHTKQADTQQSIIKHGANAFSSGLSAAATFYNIFSLKGIASKAALALNYVIGSSQAVLAIGSLTLTGIETYNYLQFKSLIDEIEEMIQTLEQYQEYKQKQKKSE